jgi:hypothetical protein
VCPGVDVQFNNCNPADLPHGLPAQRLDEDIPYIIPFEPSIIPFAGEPVGELSYLKIMHPAFFFTRLPKGPQALLRPLEYNKRIEDGTFTGIRIQGKSKDPVPEGTQVTNLWKYLITELWPADPPIRPGSKSAKAAGLIRHLAGVYTQPFSIKSRGELGALLMEAGSRIYEDLQRADGGLQTEWKDAELPARELMMERIIGAELDKQRALAAPAPLLMLLPPEEGEEGVPPSESTAATTSDAAVEDEEGGGEEEDAVKKRKVEWCLGQTGGRKRPREAASGLGFET